MAKFSLFKSRVTSLLCALLAAPVHISYWSICIRCDVTSKYTTLCKICTKYFIICFILLLAYGFNFIIVLFIASSAILSSITYPWMKHIFASVVIPVTWQTKLACFDSWKTYKHFLMVILSFYCLWESYLVSDAVADWRSENYVSVLCTKISERFKVLDQEYLNLSHFFILESIYEL